MDAETPITQPTDRPWEGRAILHVDLDAFFAAVEQLDHPEWRGLPVIVGGSPTRRGVVSTASYEAREFGVRSAMPSARAAQLCPHAIWAPSRFDRYHEMSALVFAIFREESPQVQPVSIDEAYLDVTPGRFSNEHPISIARRIRARVAELGITCSAGLSASKSVAKIASDFDKPDGLTVVWPGDESAFLSPLPVRALGGIGPRSAERLNALGIKTLGDLAALDGTTAIAILGSHGPALVARAGGHDERGVHEREGAKSVSKERTFSVDVRTVDEVSGALDGLCAGVGSRLRRKGMAGRTITVKLRFSDFTTRTVRRTLPAPTADEAVFGPVAQQLVREAWTPGVGLRLLGVGVSGFDAAAVQLDLLQDAPGPGTASPGGAVQPPAGRDPGLVRGIDAVRERFGEGALLRGRDLDSRRGKDSPEAPDAAPKENP